MKALLSPSRLTIREQQARTILTTTSDTLRIAEAFRVQQVERANLPPSLLARSEASDAAMAQRMTTNRTESNA